VPLAGGAHVERVGVGVAGDLVELAPVDRHQQVGHLGAVGGDVQVRRELGGRVAQPHRRDVAGDHERRAVGLDAQRAAQGVAVAVREQRADLVAEALADGGTRVPHQVVDPLGHVGPPSSSSVAATGPVVRMLNICERRHGRKAPARPLSMIRMITATHGYVVDVARGAGLGSH
jgi:hypothetical protein